MSIIFENVPKIIDILYENFYKIYIEKINIKRSDDIDNCFFL